MNKKPYIVTIGRSTMDEFYTWKHFPQKGNKVFLDLQHAAPGGFMINCASVMGALGANSYVLENLGDDKYTKVHLDAMESCGIDTSYITIEKGCDNSRAIIARAPGESEKTIFLFNRAFGPIPIEGKNLELVQNADMVFYSIKNMKEYPDPEGLLEQIRSKGAKLVMDAETTTFDSAESEAFYFERTHVISFNEFAFDKFCGGKGDENIRKLFEKNPDCIILHTLGADGCRVLTKDETFEMAAFPVDPVDTTGAGDTFNGTFFFGLLQGWDLRKCAKYACAAGARATLSVGARTGAVPLSVVEDFLRERGAL